MCSSHRALRSPREVTHRSLTGHLPGLSIHQARMTVGDRLIQRQQRSPVKHQR